MKTLRKITISFILASLVATMLVSCKKDDNANPAVNYIRVTKPSASDSLLTSAYLGDLIVIMGNDMGSIRELWFNDQKANLNPAYVTSTSIIVNVPSTIPGAVSDTMKMVFADKSVLRYPFKINVPSPVIDDMVCEYVADGGNAVLEGNYFIDDPKTKLQVLFPGDIAGEIVSFTLKQLVVKVPAGVVPGPVKVKSVYGSATSRFYFRDNRNMILNFDDLTADWGWRSGDVSSTLVPKLTGNYVTFTGKAVGNDFPWNEDGVSFNLWGSANGRPNVPFYSGDIDKAAIKFEIWVVEPWKAYAMQMIFTPWSDKGNNDYIATTAAQFPRGLWRPWEKTGSYQTEGWTTVSIPLSTFIYKNDGTKCDVPLTNSFLGGLTFDLYAGGVKGQDCKLSMAIDNIRIVPL